MEWIALAIPIIFTLATYLIFKHKLLWWELLLPIAASFILIVIFKVTYSHSKTSDKEFWTTYGVEAVYYEDWNETVPCMHTKFCTDSKGNSYACGTQHMYDVDYHPEYYEIVDNTKDDWSISKNSYRYLSSIWKQPVFVELNRNYHSNDGNAYVSYWNKLDSTMRVLCAEHTWTNKTLGANSVFSFKKVSETERKTLYEYPSHDKYYQRTLLGWDLGQRELDLLNAKLGSKKKVKTFILVYKNKPKDIAILQEQYWKRGNKNELIICLGVNGDSTIAWAYPFSWTDKQELVINIRDYLSENADSSFNSIRFVDWLYPQVDSLWVKKNFREFNYLKVELSTAALLWIFGLTSLVSCATLVFGVLNDLNQMGTNNDLYNRKMR